MEINSKIKNINHKCVVKGDAKYQNIAAHQYLQKPTGLIYDRST